MAMRQTSTGNNQSARIDQSITYNLRRYVPPRTRFRLHLAPETATQLSYTRKVSDIIPLTTQPL
ncbi:hypothetical protein C8R42DRAFT_729505 [Lentinula raphanica]|nr:hypothetical protein C8R42DRAFT_729505 [Lentinula raphanica]